ncbi:hypothetical protein C8R45DRAFT_1083798 [Mycena sanguinolenta]|nr:hypothetical protein C8R45DRAFT_1083798 [Mycena sanguinolenta]
MIMADEEMAASREFFWQQDASTGQDAKGEANNRERKREKTYDVVRGRLVVTVIAFLRGRGRRKRGDVTSGRRTGPRVKRWKRGPSDERPEEKIGRGSGRRVVTTRTRKEGTGAVKGIAQSRIVVESSKRAQAAAPCPQWRADVSSMGDVKHKHSHSTRFLVKRLCYSWKQSSAAAQQDGARTGQATILKARSSMEARTVMLV